MTSPYQKLGTQIGALVDRKNAAYGSSFEKCGDFLRLLYPDGVPPSRLEDALLLVRIFDKQMRIATDQDAFGESPYEDIAGYGLLGAQRQKEKREKCHASASEQDATTQSKAQPASAARPTSKPTTTSESEPAASATSPQPASSSLQSTGATAPTAAGNAPASAVGRGSEEYSTLVGRCLSILKIFKSYSPGAAELADINNWLRVEGLTEMRAHEDAFLTREGLIELLQTGSWRITPLGIRQLQLQEARL